MINETMNLKKVQEWLTGRGLTAMAENLSSFEEYAVDGNLRTRVIKDYFYNYSPNGELFKELECDVVTYMQDYKFTFETQQELWRAESSGYIPDYDCVRVEIRHPQGGGVDFPCKSREDFLRVMADRGHQIVKVYPSVHWYEREDYL